MDVYKYNTAKMIVNLLYERRTRIARKRINIVFAVKLETLNVSRRRVRYYRDEREREGENIRDRGKREKALFWE